MTFVIHWAYKRALFLTALPTRTNAGLGEWLTSSQNSLSVGESPSCIMAHCSPDGKVLALSTMTNVDPAVDQLQFGIWEFG